MVDGSFSGFKLLFGISIYWIVYFLILTSIIYIKTDYAVSDNCIDSFEKPDYFIDNSNFTRENSTVSFNSADVSGVEYENFWSVLNDAIKYAFGFNIKLNCVGELNFIFVIIFSIIPAIIFIIGSLQVLIGIIP
jgi:dipeptide/tripeptide permease